MGNGGTTPLKPLGLFAMFAAAVLPVLADPKTAADTFAPKFLGMLVIAAVGLIPLYRLARSGPLRFPARLAVGFLIVALVSALLSPSPLTGIFGLYLWGTAWLFWLAVVGGWAIGASLDEDGRRLLFAGLLFGVLANACLGIVQVLGVKHIPSLLSISTLLTPYEGQADGFLGNPIHLESMLMGGLALVLGRCCRKPWPWAVPVLVMAVALEMSSERLALVLVCLLIAYALWKYPWRRAAIYAGTIVLGYGLGLISGTGVTVAGRVDESTTNTTYGLRLKMWETSLRAVAHHPLLGIGPGQTRTATAALITPAFQRLLGPGRYFTDAHNILLEVLVTTGIVGLALFAGWLASSMWGSSGALLGFGVFVLLVCLVEPINIGTEPIALMAIGGAAALRVERAGHVVPTPKPSTGARVLNGIVITLALLLGVSMVVGDTLLNTAKLSYTLSSAKSANTWYPEYADSADEVSNVYAYLSVADHHGYRHWVDGVIHWERVALQRDPSNVSYWTNIGAAYEGLGDYSASSAAYETALSYSPYSAAALAGLGGLATKQHRFAAAVHWYSLLASTDPTDPLARQDLSHAERALRRTGASTASS